MTESIHFLRSVLDTIAENIVVIDRHGDIRFVNQSWVDFGSANQLQDGIDWTRMNYLSVCDNAARAGDESAGKAAAGIRSVLAGDSEEFYLEYPCHAPDRPRWFILRAVPFSVQNNDYVVLSHQDITERKLAEEAVVKVSRMDGLTGVANRRYFNEFLDEEWRRCARLRAPLSLAIVDIDHFKRLNDKYGHVVGDDCLKAVAKLLDSFMRRPSDLCARFGGEEFILVLGNMAGERARSLCDDILTAVRQLSVPTADGGAQVTLTVSIGLASTRPGAQIEAKALVNAADEKLYQAKRAGRDQLLS